MLKFYFAVQFYYLMLSYNYYVSSMWCETFLNELIKTLLRSTLRKTIILGKFYAAAEWLIKYPSRNFE